MLSALNQPMASCEYKRMLDNKTSYLMTSSTDDELKYY